MGRTKRAVAIDFGAGFGDRADEMLCVVALVRDRVIPPKGKSQDPTSL
jgi:hypothetical protein